MELTLSPRPPGTSPVGSPVGKAAGSPSATGGFGPASITADDPGTCIASLTLRPGILYDGGRA